MDKYTLHIKILKNACICALDCVHIGGTYNSVEGENLSLILLEVTICLLICSLSLPNHSEIFTRPLASFGEKWLELRLGPLNKLSHSGITTHLFVTTNFGFHTTIITVNMSFV